MKATIDESGILRVIAENPIDSYALSKWKIDNPETVNLAVVVDLGIYKQVVTNKGLTNVSEYHYILVDKDQLQGDYEDQKIPSDKTNKRRSEIYYPDQHEPTAEDLSKVKEETYDEDIEITKSIKLNWICETCGENCFEHFNYRYTKEPLSFECDKCGRIVINHRYGK